MRDNARGLPAPRAAPIARQVIPMQGLRVIRTFGRVTESPNHISKCAVIVSASRAVGWFREFEANALTGANTNDEQPPSVLGQPIIFRVKHLPCHPVTGESKSHQLVPQKLIVL